MTHHHEAGKGSKPRRPQNKRLADVNREIFYGGWILCELDPPGTNEREERIFYNHHDPEIGRRYWRPLSVAVDYENLAKKAGATE